MKYQYILIAALLAGCSQGGSSNSDQNPKSTVNSKITGSAASALSGQTAVFEASRSLSQSSGMAFTESALPRIAMMEAMSGGRGGSEVEAKTSRIATLIQNGGCQIDLQKPNQSGAMDGTIAENFSPLKMKIAGSTCPMEISFEMLMTSPAGQPCQSTKHGMVCFFTATVKMTYRVLDANLASELGVANGQSNMTFEVNQTLPSQSGSMSSDPMSGEEPMKMAIKGKANIFSKAVDLSGGAHLITGEQNINMTMVISPQAGSVPQAAGSVQEGLKYLQTASGVESNLSAELIMKGNSADEKYFVDGVRVTAQAYMSERDKFANSMMAFTTNGDQQTPDRGGRPSPDTGYPPGGDLPPSNTGHTPSNPSTPSQPSPSGEWVCVIENYDSRNVFIGYGTQEFIARSHATQACQGAGSVTSCSSVYKCEQQELSVDAWYCEAKNSDTGRVFGRSGHSKVEAGYFARRECFHFSGSSARSCGTVYDSDCVRQ